MHVIASFCIDVCTIQSLCSGLKSQVGQLPSDKLFFGRHYLISCLQNSVNHIQELVSFGCENLQQFLAEPVRFVLVQVGWWFKPWFYQHAETCLKKGEFVEYIPTREYYHRHTRCLYWEGKLILPFADQFWFRYLLGWMMPPKVSFLKATQVISNMQIAYSDFLFL